MRYQFLAEQRFGCLFDFGVRFTDFDTARFAARAGMNLRFDHPDIAVDFPSALHGFHYAIGQAALRNLDAVLGQYFFCLIFVNIHFSFLNNRMYALIFIVSNYQALKIKAASRGLRH